MELCGAMDRVLSLAKAHVVAPSLNLGRFNVQQIVGVFADEQFAAKAFATMNSSKTWACLRSELHARVQRRVGSAAVGAMSSAIMNIDAAADRGSARRLTVSLAVLNATLWIDVYIAKIRNGVTAITIASSFDPISYQLDNAVAESAVERFRAALVGQG